MKLSSKALQERESERGFGNHRKRRNRRNLISSDCVSERIYISLNPIYDKHKHELVACLIINKHFKLIFIQNGLWCVGLISRLERALWSLQHFIHFGSSGQQFQCVCVSRWYRLKCSRWCVSARLSMCVCVCVWCCLFLFPYTFMLIFMDDDQVSTILYAAPLNNFIVWIVVLLLGITDTLISFYIIITENICFPSLDREKSVQSERTTRNNRAFRNGMSSMRSHSFSLYHAAAAGKIGIRR